MVDWDAMISREGPAVWRTVYRLLGNRADAEDCFQETFLAALGVWRRESVQAFCLFYLDGWDYAQIATELDGNVNAVGVWLHRARHQLAKLLKSHAPNETIKAVKS